VAQLIAVGSNTTFLPRLSHVSAQKYVDNCPTEAMISYAVNNKIPKRVGKPEERCYPSSEHSFWRIL